MLWWNGRWTSALTTGLTLRGTISGCAIERLSMMSRTWRQISGDTPRSQVPVGVVGAMACSIYAADPISAYAPETVRRVQECLDALLPPRAWAKK